jgi:Ni,Fe-hydrogenase I large subunit
MLAKRLDGYEAEAEGCEAKIEQMVAAMNMPKPQVLEVLAATAAAVKETQSALQQATFGVARNVKVYNETLAALQARMVALGVPEAEAKGFGFGPLPDPKGGARTQPSGMVATPFNPTHTRAALAYGKENGGGSGLRSGGPSESA